MTFQQVAAGAGADVRANENFDAVANAGVYGRKAPTTSGLTFGYYGGHWNGFTVVDGTVALTASATNYIVALISTGVVSVATNTTNWNSPLYLRLHQIVTGTATITTWDDYRPTLSLVAVPLANPMTTAGDIIIGGTAGAATRLGIGTDTQVLTLASGVPTWANSASGFANPMTTAADMIVGGVSGAGARLAKGTAYQHLRMNSGATAQEWATPLVAIPIAISDEVSAILTGTSKVTFRMPFPMKVTAVRSSLTTAQASGAQLVTVDIKESGTTILSTKLTFDNTEKTTTTAATPPVISDPDLADDAEMTIDVTVQSGSVAAGLKVYLIGYVAQ